MEGKSVGVAKILMIGKTFGDRMTRLTKVLDPAIHTEQSQIDLANRDGRLRPGISQGWIMLVNGSPVSVRCSLR